MSLDWNVTACNPECKTEKNWPTTDALIWASLAIGLRTLTNKNVDEWRVRLAMWEAVYPKSWGHLVDLAPAEWAMRYGLTTNVSDTSRAYFKRRIADWVEREAEADLRRSTCELMEKLEGNVVPIKKGAKA